MSCLTKSLITAALAGVLASGAAYAQQSTPSPRPAPAVTAPMKPVETKASPTAWDKTKAMSRKQWNAAKNSWAMEKGKWNDCTKQSKAEKLRGTKRWTFIGNCMTK